MKLVLDTHAFHWWIAEKHKLPSTVSAAISSPERNVVVSVASAWEMSIKVGAGRWPGAVDLVDRFGAHLAAERFGLLSLSIPHVRAAGLMQSPHRDPFDRLLAAQAQIEGLTLVTAGPKVQALRSDWLW